MNDEYARLRWRCRRGMHELDTLLQRWLREVYPEVSETQRKAFARLLESPDPQLWDWLVLKKAYPDPDLAKLCESIGRFR